MSSVLIALKCVFTIGADHESSEHVPLSDGVGFKFIKPNDSGPVHE